MLRDEKDMQLHLNEETLKQMNGLLYEKKNGFKKFPYVLKKFALTLNFYSPVAYKYVRF